MREAVRWVEAESRSRGATRVILKYMAERLEGCIAVVGVDQLARGAKISRRTVFRCLRSAEKLGEVEKIHRVPVNAYHFRRGVTCFLHSEAKHVTVRCPQVLSFQERAGRGDILSYIRGTQLSLLGEAVPPWQPIITDEELRWRANELRMRLGLPALRAPTELRLT
jgi:hypothetical protein